MDIKKLDVPALLRQLAEMREKMPKPEGPRRAGPLPGSSATRTKLLRSGNSMADFETQALIDALEAMAEEIRTVIAEKEAKALEMALDAFYVAEDLIRDPQHAELIPQVEALRAAYERDFGRPIPPRKPKS
ncbi:MAG: hypothetical protein ABI831_27430 [Betaproteobacteria bacterium]